jgi:hypothetical protein
MSESPATSVLAYDLADRLNKSLRIAGIKPGEMRTVLGVGSSTMTNYLSGRTRPKDGMLRQWAFRCGPPISFDWLAYGIVTVDDDGPDGGSVQGIDAPACTRSQGNVITFPTMSRATQLPVAA